MGCFDGTCALTGVAIRHGDLVLHLVARRCKEAQLYELLQALVDTRHYCRRYPDDMRRFAEHFLKEPFDPKRAPAPDPLGYLKEMYHYTVARATYNDYGWVEEYEKPEEPYRHFMIHWPVAIRVAEVGSIAPGDLFGVLRAVAELLFTCRVNPWLDLPAGYQHYDINERLGHEERIDLIRLALALKEEV